MKTIMTKVAVGGGGGRICTHLRTTGGAGALRLKQLLWVSSWGIQLSKLNMDMRKRLLTGQRYHRQLTLHTVEYNIAEMAVQCSNFNFSPSTTLMSN